MILSGEILQIKCATKPDPDLLKKQYLGVSIDSRKIKSSEIFFAIKGESKDGHDFIPDVVSKKPGLIVVNEKWYEKNRLKYKEQQFLVVKDTVKALGELAAIHRERMNIPVFVVAGSNGKTTTKDLIGEVLSKKFKLLKTDGNFNNHIGLPLTLLKITELHDFCLLEAGSNHFRELEYLCNIAKQDFSLVTNIGKEHLEFFGNIKGVAKEELSVYDYVFKNGYCNFYNLDDTYIRNYYKQHKGKSFSYSYGYDADVKGIKKSYNKNFNPEISYLFEGRRYVATVSTFGEHSFYNGLSAIAAGLYFGIKPEEISDALMNLRYLSDKRMQVEKSDGITVINDSYNSNPDSVKMGLQTVKKFYSKGRKHIVLSDMLEMGKASEREHGDIGRFITAMNFDFLYTYGEQSYFTFKAAKKMKYNFHFKEKKDLIEFIRHNLKKDDIVYVKGSRGMKMEEVVNNLLNINKI